MLSLSLGCSQQSTQQAGDTNGLPWPWVIPGSSGACFLISAGAVMDGQSFIHSQGATAPRVDGRGRVCWAQGLHGVSCVHMGLVEGGGTSPAPPLPEQVGHS